MLTIKKKHIKLSEKITLMTILKILKLKKKIIINISKIKKYDLFN